MAQVRKITFAEFRPMSKDFEHFYEHIYYNASTGEFVHVRRPTIDDPEYLDWMEEPPTGDPDDIL
jgi:hypothetical protein